VLTLALVLAARVVVVPGVVDEQLDAAAHAAGVDIVDEDAARAALALIDDPACGEGDARCLARLALVAEADAVVVTTDVHGDRVDAVVVTAAAERRRVQASRATLVEDVARALAPTAGARLHIVGDARFVVDDVAIEADAARSLDVTPGEHRVAAFADGCAPAVVVVHVAAGETLWLAPTPTPLPSSSMPPAATSTAPVWWTATATATGVLGVGGIVAGGVLGTIAMGAIDDAEAARFQSDRVGARDAANANIAGAVVALSLGAAAVATAVVMFVVGAPP
jgi:hypothetical protein